MVLIPREAFNKFRSPLAFIESLKEKLKKCAEEDTNNTIDVLTELQALTTNVERVDFLLTKLDQYGLLLDVFRQDKKNESNAKACCKKAVSAVGKSKYIEALHYFTSCATKAESPAMLAETYIERADILMKLEQFEGSVQDLDRALKLGKFSATQTSGLRHRRTKVEFNANSTPKPRFYDTPPSIQPDNQHPSISCTTRSIEIRLDEKNKQRVFACKDIEIGEVVAVEKPVTFFVIRGELCHCHHCFELCYNPIPCESCTQLVFCSEECRNSASSTYHKHECPLLLTLNKICGLTKLYQLALRVTFLMEEERNADLAQKTRGLIENMSIKNVDDDVFTASLSTAVIFSCVKRHTTRFDETKSEDEDKFKNSLFTYLRICSVYGTIINELYPDTKRRSGEPKYQWDTVGRGLYVFYSAIRHSCAPNLFVHHHGSTQVLRATRTIKEGEECFVSHGIDYIEFKKEKRQKMISRQFHFKCCCKACENDWVRRPEESYLRKNQLEAKWGKKLMEGEVKEALRYVSVYTNRIKEFEHKEPDFNLCLVTEITSYTCALLGNIRRINFDF